VRSSAFDTSRQLNTKLCATVRSTAFDTCCHLATTICVTVHRYLLPVSYNILRYSTLILLSFSLKHSSKWYCYKSKYGKLFLNGERPIPSAQAPSVSREEIASTRRSKPVFEQLPFFIFDKTAQSFPLFNATGRGLLIKFNSPGEERDPMTCLKECITTLTNYVDVPSRDLVGMRIRNTENLQDKVVGFSLRRWYQFFLVLSGACSRKLRLV